MKTPLIRASGRSKLAQPDQQCASISRNITRRLGCGGSDINEAIRLSPARSVDWFSELNEENAVTSVVNKSVTGGPGRRRGRPSNGCCADAGLIKTLLPQ